MAATPSPVNQRETLRQSKRLVVKVGTALLAAGGGTLNTRFLGRLAAEIADLRKQGREVILVSSGAIGSGMQAMGCREKPRTIPAKQALAAIGQPRLMQAYTQVFRRRGLHVAQILLTAEDIDQRQRYAHARNTLLEILRLGVIPIFNENDTVAVDEIKFGDNDTLSAHITHLAGADALILLTDVAGLYSEDPGVNPRARLLSRVERVDSKIEALAGGARGGLGTGGMATKIRAAKMVTAMGEKMVIAAGREPGVLKKIISGEEIGTLFLPLGDKLTARKRWIAFALKSRGRLSLDAGAVAAVRQQGKSLLPSGIRGVEGNFQAGDSVGLVDAEGREFGRGLVQYPAAEVRKLAGAKTTEIEKILGYKAGDEVIHRDDLVLLGGNGEENTV